MKLKSIKWPVSRPIIRDRHRQILSLIKFNWNRLAIAMACSFMVAVTTSATAFLVKPVLDDIFFKQDMFMLKVLPLAVIFIYLLRGAGIYGHEYFMNYVGQSIIRRLRDLLYDKIQDLDLAFFAEEKTGVLMSRITNDVNIIKSMVSTAVTGILRDAFTIVGLTFVIFYRDWKMAIFALVILPVAFLPVVKFGKRVRKISRGCQESMADLNSFLHETFFGNKIVKAFGMEWYEKERFKEKNSELFRLEIKNVVARSLSTPIMEFLAGLGIAFVIWYGGYQVITGSSTPGTFFSFMAAVLMLYDPVKKLSRLNNAVQQGMSAADRIFDVLEKETTIVEAENPVELETKPHSVAFKNVHLEYSDGTMALKGIDIDVKPGEVLALVGMSGGGKTSLVNLIPRFYDVSEGRVEIDGIDIRDISLSSLRKEIAIVTQDTILFNNTVRNNIAYGNLDADDEAIERAAKAAFAYDFIQTLPKKFDTVIGELGGRLSGGERQRICIARAILKDAPILILDEATSALDTESEMLVKKALENLMKGRTTFIIAHRLSTINYANRIIVLVDGKIAEQGTHLTLLDKQGEYYKLYRMQFEDENRPPENNSRKTGF